MCGITGIVNLGTTELNIPQTLVKMNNALRHRGPDDEGYSCVEDEQMYGAWGEETPTEVIHSDFSYSPKVNVEQTETRIAFGHRRLSIIDLSPAGHQPMCDGNKVWIVYNGEIYNHIELRENLKSKGHQFKTSTDTEVILAAYQEWGKDCVNEFNGMWAFVIYDQQKQIIWGSRDITGVKPLYYSFHHGVFAFASEQKALLEAPFIERQLNPNAAFDFFVFGTLEHDSEGFFSGIKELQQSHSFVLNLPEASFKTWRHCHIPYTNTLEGFDSNQFSNYSSKIAEKINLGITQRLRSDVAIGSCLSGGMDSSSIVCTINQLLKTQKNAQIGDQLKAFTTSFNEPTIDESKWAKIVVDHTQAKWFQTFPTSSELLTDIFDLVQCQDIPLKSTSTYAQYRAMKLASENGIKVVLDGQGGDELFSGYSYHHAALWSEMLRNFKFSQIANEWKFFDRPIQFLARNIGKYALVPHLPSVVKSIAHKGIFNELNYLNPDFLHDHKLRFKQHLEPPVTSLNSMLHHQFFNGPLKELLKCEDRCSMRFSLESRTVFADDRDLISHLFSIPSTYKIKNGISKLLLREAMKNIVPDAVRNRKDKMGFVTPNNQWMAELRQPLKSYFDSHSSDILNKNAILKDYDVLFNPTTSAENYRTFKFIGFALWHQVFRL